MNRRVVFELGRLTFLACCMILAGCAGERATPALWFDEPPRRYADAAPPQPPSRDGPGHASAIGRTTEAEPQGWRPRQPQLSPGPALGGPPADMTAVARWIGPSWRGHMTASGEAFDENRMTASHPTMPLPSLVVLTNQENGRRIRVRINDRTPARHGDVMLVSRAVASQLGFVHKAEAYVSIETEQVGAGAQPPDRDYGQPAQPYGTFLSTVRGALTPHPRPGDQAVPPTYPRWDNTPRY